MYSEDPSELDMYFHYYISTTCHSIRFLNVSISCHWLVEDKWVTQKPRVLIASSEIKGMESAIVQQRRKELLDCAWLHKRSVIFTVSWMSSALNTYEGWKDMQGWGTITGKTMEVWPCMAIRKSEKLGMTQVESPWRVKWCRYWWKIHI